MEKVMEGKGKERKGRKREKREGKGREDVSVLSSLLFPRLFVCLGNLIKAFCMREREREREVIRKMENKSKYFVIR